MTSLVEKYALLPAEIDSLSLRMVEDSLPGGLDLTPAERYVVCRIVRAEGDPDIAHAVRFSPGAVERGLDALRRGVAVVTDVRMVEVGISRALLNRRGISTHCMIDAPQTHERARREGTTRSVAAVRELAPRMNGAVVAIGNAPTALLAPPRPGAKGRNFPGPGHRNARRFRRLRRIQRRTPGHRRSFRLHRRTPGRKFGGGRHGQRPAVIAVRRSGPVTQETRNPNDPTAKAANSPWGVVLVAHGSQRGASSAECSCSWPSPEAETPEWCLHCPNTPQGLNDAAARLQEVLGEDRATVRLSCLEFIEPRPDATIQDMAAQGLQRVVVMPYLLGQGKHVTLEMDEVLDEARAGLPGIDLQLAGVLGADPRLADVVVERVLSIEEAAPERTAGERTGILLVKAGTRNQYDDCVWLHQLGRTVETMLGENYAVAVAQSHYGDPTVEAAAAQLVEERGVSRIVTVPYIFFPGLILKRNVLGGLDRLRARYPQISLAVTPPLGVDDRVVEVAADRVRQAWERAESPG